MLGAVEAPTCVYQTQPCYVWVKNPIPSFALLGSFDERKSIYFAISICFIVATSVHAMSSPNAVKTFLSAPEIVKEITRLHGFLDESVYAKMEPDVRHEVEEAMLMKDEMIGSSVITYE